MKNLQNDFEYNDEKCNEDISKKDVEKNLPRRWDQLSYAGTSRITAGEEIGCSSWPMYFIKQNADGGFVDINGNPLIFRIKEPNTNIDFEGEQLKIVEETLRNITDEEITIARYWGHGAATKQWTPIIDRLIDTYKVSAPRAARILAATHAALNDTFIVTWHFKYLWKISRPNQLNQNLITVLKTPRHPSYPAGHASLAGCAQMVLSYFFEAEAERLRELAEECAQSRLYAGVHYKVDNDEGLRLGRYIGQVVVDILKNQRSGSYGEIDYPIIKNLDAQLPPPPYEQAIP